MGRGALVPWKCSSRCLMISTGLGHGCLVLSIGALDGLATDSMAALFFSLSMHCSELTQCPAACLTPELNGRTACDPRELRWKGEDTEHENTEWQAAASIEERRLPKAGRKCVQSRVGVWGLCEDKLAVEWQVRSRKQHRTASTGPWWNTVTLYSPSDHLQTDQDLPFILLYSSYYLPAIGGIISSVCSLPISPTEM